MDGDSQVCKTNQLVTGTMDSRQKVNVDLWYNRANPYYKAVCYFWCTNDGIIPEPKPSVTIDHDLVSRLVNIVEHYFFFQTADPRGIT